MYSAPFHFLFDRGNLDGFTLLLLSIGMALLAGRGAGGLGRDLAAGFFLAAAIAFKVYPALIALPLLALRRWRPLAAPAGAMAGFILLSPALWLSWLEWFLADRGGWFANDANGSLANTFFHVGGLFGYAGQLKAAAIYVWAAMLLAMVALDFKALSAARSDGKAALTAMALYVPFMLAVPSLVHHYALVCVLILLPVVCHLWANAASAGEKRILALITVGLILTQFHAYAVEELLRHAFGITRCSLSARSLACLPQWLPGFGLLLTMLGALAYKALPFTAQRALAEMQVADGEGAVGVAA